MGSPPAPLEAAPGTRHPASHAPVCPAPGSPGEREALSYLRRELLPDLRRGHRDDVARTVELALERGTLAPLRTLPASQKHSLLGALEARLLGRSRPHAPGASVVVKLIACLDPTPPELLEVPVRHPVLPSR